MKKRAQKRILRTQYLVNRRLQIHVTLQLMAVTAGIGLLYTLALHVLPAPAAGVLQTPEMSSFVINSTLIYFGIATVILGTLTIILTNRIAGPAFVIHRAVAAMRRGDYSERLTLRGRDHFKGLAAEIAALREEIVARDGRMQDLKACLETGDIEAATELLAQLGTAPITQEPSLLVQN